MGKKTLPENYDPYLIEKIQPEGGISFKHEKYVSVGNGYEICVHIYDYPKELETHWLGNILNIDNTVAIVDVSTEDLTQVKVNINKSMTEQKQRYRNAKTFDEEYDAEVRFQELKRLWTEIQSMGEVVKIIQSRVFVYARTLQELEERCKTILVNFESNNYKAAIFLNEGKAEWKSMYLPFVEQQKERNAMYGQPVTSESLAGGYPFHYSSLEDPQGTLLGFTASGGIMLFDWFHSSDSRRQYNGSVVGTMGSGKSTLLKKFFLDRAIRGDFIRAFDISGEFSVLTEELGGVIISLDGSMGIINPLQILRAGDDEKTNYTQHISKLHTWYRFVMPKADDYELIELEEQARKLYINKGLLLPNGDIGENKITGRKGDQYPILEELLSTVRESMKELSKTGNDFAKKIIYERKLQSLDRLAITLENLINNYGHIFNGYTTINNILDEQIITFDMSTIKNLKSNIFDTQIFNTLSLCWDNAVSNGSVMKDLWETGQVAWEDIIHSLIIADESHRWINAKKLHAVDQLTLQAREGRKYFTGILLASQSIRDYVPENSGKEGVDALKTLFELMQYKFVFQQDSASKELLRTIFEGQFTETEIGKIPFLERGQTILSVSSDQNYEFKVDLTEEERKLFRGGV